MNDDLTAAGIAPADATSHAPLGALTIVMGAKGGCGATLIACNLAHQLADDRRVLLVDLDVGNGDIAAALDLRSGRSINFVLDNLARGDDALVIGAADQLPGGLSVLAQPYDMEDLRDLKADEARALIDLCRRTFAHVIVDVGSTLHVGALAAAELADEVLLVASPDVPTLRDALRRLRLLHRLGVQGARVRLVLNKVSPSSPVALAEVEEQLAVPIAVTLPRDDAACRVADAKGHTLDRAAPRSALTRKLAGLWSALHTGDAASR